MYNYMYLCTYMCNFPQWLHMDYFTKKMGCIRTLIISPTPHLIQLHCHEWNSQRLVMYYYLRQTYATWAMTVRSSKIKQQNWVQILTKSAQNGTSQSCSVRDDWPWPILRFRRPVKNVTTQKATVGTVYAPIISTIKISTHTCMPLTLL